ncbi:hypothetical protein FISHEDRAFT_71476 [Fistulina hepatica ATCC 64428]|uniref:RING-type domain-containing protein n=1 Tax=Fistulina hepatica ATCC 64428 TaxID=1128425 RepID=A0A0D7AGK1_9AGAR|nr:hypothetical protein FISHEDRAFT_71476 [Fistulina hepatica ATCC 64428]
MDNPSNDPRNFQNGGDFEDAFAGPIPGTLDPFSLLGIPELSISSGSTEITEHQSGILEALGTPRATRSPPPSGGFRFEMTTGSNGTRTIRMNRTQGTSDGVGNEVPTLSDYTQRPNPNLTGGQITGAMMAQYLLALLGRDPFSDLEMQNGSGRLGDYVFNQEGWLNSPMLSLDNSSANRPVPAPEDVAAKLPRVVLEEGSELLQKDCAVCKDPFKLETEDPDEQVIVTLPCNHPFHEPCILPWLKSSGTCPVCRFALVPQPEHHDPPNTGSSGGSPRPPSGSSTSRSTGGGAGAGTGLMSMFSGLLGSGGSQQRTSSSRSAPSRPQPEHRHPRSQDSRRGSTRSSGSSGQHQPPGAWDSEGLD